MRILRTPDERFHHLPGYPFEPNYVEIPDGEGGILRIHYVDEGPKDAEAVLLLHGEPTWSYLYRKMIPIFIQAGYRTVAPDLVGFGRSDKPADRKDYTYQRHVDWTRAMLKHFSLAGITLVCHDWGGLIGLRLVAEKPEIFARVVATNTSLSTGQIPHTSAFVEWRKFSMDVPEFEVGWIIKMGSKTSPPDDVVAAYDAPFPDESYKEGARIFPALVPIKPDEPAAIANRQAWKILSNFEKPFLTAFSDSDPITSGRDTIFQTRIPGAKNQRHTIIKDAGHFLQEDKGEEFARVVIDFIAQNPV
jgi:haloalkane dehalogenase